MPTCPNCSYTLVLLQHRNKYKCALCSKLFSQKEIDAKDFREWNKRQRELEKFNFKPERKSRIRLSEEERRLRTKETKKKWRLKNKEKVLRYKYDYRKKYKENYNQEMKSYRQKHKEEIKLNNRLAQWRKQQKELALQLPSTNNVSEPLNISKPLKII